MKYNMIQKSGAFRECIVPQQAEPIQPIPLPSVAGGSLTETGYISPSLSPIMAANSLLPLTKPMHSNDQIGDSAANLRSPGAITPFPQSNANVTSSLYERNTMFFYVIPEGQRVLVTDKYGRSKIIDGPARIAKWGKHIRNLVQHTAYPGEFLVVKYRNGDQTHIPGPCQEWLDPRIHVQIEKHDALQIAGKEAVVVYAKNETGALARRIIQGPALFVPNPGEWIHTFSWHGAKDGQYKKVPGGLVFQKLWLMPDQIYHDVENVCTADDVPLTIKLMLFFELTDVEKMIEATHDPIGDFINAAGSDVISFLKRYTYDDFKSHSEQLNEIATYPQLLYRAEQVGYHILKTVYRGHITADTLQNMHNKAIETRTRLKLEREAEEQSQKLADYKQKCEAERAIQRRQQEKEHEIHELEKQRLRHEQALTHIQMENDQQYAEEARKKTQQLAYLKELQALGVDITRYLTYSRPDHVIEVRGTEKPPHLHIDSEKRSS